MVPRENLEESVVRTGRDFPAGGNPCLFNFKKKLRKLQGFPMLAKIHLGFYNSGRMLSQDYLRKRRG
jgi:hypothetical protein